MTASALPWVAPQTHTESSPSYYGWRILVVSVIGLAFSPGPLFWGSLGLFVEHFVAEFGWSRSEIMLALLWVTVASVPALPLVGRIIDRFGVYRVLLPSVVLLAALLLAVPFTLASLLGLYTLFFLAGFLPIATQSVSYIRVLSAWFDQRRGIAIGIAASGVGLGYAVIPVLVQWGIANFGWRGGYVVLAGVVAFVVFPLLALILRNSPHSYNQRLAASDVVGPEAPAAGPAAQAPAEEPGLTVPESLRTREFWVIFFGILTIATIFNALLPSMVPLLTDGGIPVKHAVAAVSLMGVSIAIGRIVVGFCLDYVFAPYLACVIFGVASLAVFVLGTTTIPLVIYIAVIFVGLGFGAETDLMGYLVGRYFGLRNFGQLYGIALAAFLIGTGIGPFLLNHLYEIQGTYSPTLVAASCLGAVVSVAFLLLGKYRF